MQNWEEYEADYYGLYPDGHMRGNAPRERRNWPPYEPEDRMDTGMRDGDWMGEMPRGRWDKNMCPVDRMGNPVCHGNMRNRNMYPESAGMMRQDSREVITDEPMRRPTGEDDILRDMDEFEELFDELSEEIMEIIRRICDSVDGEGCIAMEGQMTRELLEMMVDRVMEQMGENDQLSAVQTDWRKSLISALLLHELLRRRMRRRMHNRNRGDFRDRWKR